MFTRYGRLIVGALSLLLSFASLAEALTASFVSAAPTVAPRDGTVPPLPNTSLFVFPGTVTGIQYTLNFTVSEQPGAVVVTGGELESYSYDAATGALALVMTHTGYLEGSELFGPPTDFAVAMIGAVPLGQDGPPAQMAGSWMSSNISVTGWELIPPSPQNKFFGYRLSGPSGQQGFFKMFVPQGLIDLLSQVGGQNITVSDLALFNDGAQATTSITAVTTPPGALVDIRVTFSSESIAVSEAAEPAISRFTAAALSASAGAVSKELTVRQELPLSLAIDPKTAARGSKVTLFGWARGASAGQKVSLFGAAAGKKLALTGKPLKAVKVGADGRFSTTIKAVTSGNYQASFKPPKGKPVKSPKVKLTLRKK